MEQIYQFVRTLRAYPNPLRNHQKFRNIWVRFFFILIFLVLVSITDQNQLTVVVMVHFSTFSIGSRAMNSLRRWICLSRNAFKTKFRNRWPKNLSYHKPNTSTRMRAYTHTHTLKLSFDTAAVVTLNQTWEMLKIGNNRLDRYSTRRNVRYKRSSIGKRAANAATTCHTRQRFIRRHNFNRRVIFAYALSSFRYERGANSGCVEGGAGAWRSPCRPPSNLAQWPTHTRLYGRAVCVAASGRIAL